MVTRSVKHDKGLRNAMIYIADSHALPWRRPISISV